MIVLGDFNAEVGSEGSEDTIGPNGIGENNKRGQRIIEFCEKQNLSKFYQPLSSLVSFT